MTEEKVIYLKYTGTAAAIWNVPARDLTLEDVEKLSPDWDAKGLVATGIYEYVNPPEETKEEYVPSWEETPKKKRGK